MELREMTMDDADFMLELKNDPDTRQFAILTHDEIKKEDHYKWLEKHLYQFKVIEDNGERAGAFRLDNDEVSIWVHPKHRNKGIATKVLKKIGYWGMWARIVKDNIPSMNAFRKAGFHAFFYQDGCYSYVKY